MWQMHSVQNLEGLDRLEPQSSIVQSNRSDPGNGPVCFPYVDSTSTVFQLETRPNGRGNGYLKPKVADNLLGYVNPAWCLIAKVLSQVKKQQARVILVAPVWNGQPWYSVLLGMLCNYPWQLPRTLSSLQSEPNVAQVEFLSQLAIWPVSGRSLDV